jgi:hypothetical protein
MAAPHKLTNDERERRDAEIVRLSLAPFGLSRREVAERVGVTAMTVQRVVAKYAAALPPDAPATAPIEAPANLPRPTPPPDPGLLERLRAGLQGAAPPPPRVEEPPLPDDALQSEQLARTIRAMRREAEEAGAVNPRVAASLHGHIAKMVGYHQAALRAERALGDEIRLTAAELDAAEASALGKAAALANRAQEVGGLLCAACQRQLSIEWGGCAEKVAAATADDKAK